MRDRNDKIDGSFAFDEDTVFRGMVAGSALVCPAITLTLHGFVTGDLLVESGGTAIIHGKVNGVVSNRGGTVQIYGMVGGISDEAPGAQTTIMPGALVQS